MASEQEQAAYKRVRDSVEELLDIRGLAEPELYVTDVMALVVQRDFDGASRVVVLQPTDTPDYASLGMLAEAKIDFEESMRDRLREGREADGERD